MENELTFFKLASSKNGISARKIRKMSGMDFSRVLPKEKLGNSLSNRLREILGKNVDLENELTFYMLASSKIGIFAEKIRKLSEWGFPGFSNCAQDKLSVSV